MLSFTIIVGCGPALSEGCANYVLGEQPYIKVFVFVC
jgi:hypothetical protein